VGFNATDGSGRNEREADPEPKRNTPMFTKTAVSALALLIVAGTASAQSEASAYTDLNLRAGPGPMYEIIGLIPADMVVSVAGCLEAASWCEVTYNGMTGWASGDYLVAMVDEAPQPIYVNRESMQIATAVYEDTTTESALAGGAMGAVIGTLIAGPVGGVVGAAVLGGNAAANDPGPTVTGYVLSNPVDPIYLEGEVVVGAGIPEEVTLLEVPESEFSYAYINGVPVVVERTDRRVVYIAR